MQRYMVVVLLPQQRKLWTDITVILTLVLLILLDIKLPKDLLLVRYFFLPSSPFPLSPSPFQSSSSSALPSYLWLHLFPLPFLLPPPSFPSVFPPFLPLAPTLFQG